MIDRAGSDQTQTKISVRRGKALYDIGLAIIQPNCDLPHASQSADSPQPFGDPVVKVLWFQRLPERSNIEGPTLEFEGLQFTKSRFSNREEDLHQDETDGNTCLYREDDRLGVHDWELVFWHNGYRDMPVMVEFVCSVHRMISGLYQARTPSLVYKEMAPSAPVRRQSRLLFFLDTSNHRYRLILLLRSPETLALLAPIE